MPKDGKHRVRHAKYSISYMRLWNDFAKIVREEFKTVDELHPDQTKVIVDVCINQIMEIVKQLDKKTKVRILDDFVSKWNRETKFENDELDVLWKEVAAERNAAADEEERDEKE
jgi:predicted DNA-binding ArsR family transcriptional regulator